MFWIILYLFTVGLAFVVNAFADADDDIGLVPIFWTIPIVNLLIAIVCAISLFSDEIRVDFKPLKKYSDEDYWHEVSEKLFGI